MKKAILLTFIFFISLSSFSQQIPDPDFASRPYFLKGDGSLKSLDRSSATYDTKVKGLYRGAEVFLTVFGVQSDARFDINNLPRIFIKLDSNTDPNEVLSVVTAEIVKDRRRFLQRDQALGGKVRDVSDAVVELDYKKIRDGLWEIFLPEDLPDGEYGFMPLVSFGENMTFSSQTYISCFSIYGGSPEAASSKSSTPPIIEKSNTVNKSSNSNQYKPSTSFGIKAGLGISRTTYWGPNFTPSFLAGVQLEIPVYDDYLSIQVSGEFQKLGGIDPIEQDALHFYYLRFPVLFKGGYRFSNDMKVYGAIGPNLGFAIAGRVKNGGDKASAFNKSSFYGYDYKRFDAGISFELGYEINRKMSIAMRSTNGFFDFSGYTTIVEKNKALTFNFTYKFGNLNKVKSKPKASSNYSQPQSSPPVNTYEEKVEKKPEPAPEPKLQICSVCAGEGHITTERNVICSNKCEKGMLTCSGCQGTGNGASLGNKFNPQTNTIEQVFDKCSICSGKGIEQCAVCNGNGIELKQTKTTCSTCQGKGKL